MQSKLVVVLVIIIVALVGALAFTLGRETAPEVMTRPSLAIRPTRQTPSVSSPAMHIATATPVPQPSPSPSAGQISAPQDQSAERSPLPGARPFTDQVDDFRLKFLPTRDFRLLIEWRTNPTVDTSCSPTYTAQERVTRVNYAWSFVISSFNTWNSREGQQEYMINEETLPNAYQGSLHDIVRQGRMLTIEKQRCGQGQVEGLIAVRH